MLRRPGGATPHIDRLAASGVLFERAYNQLPLCNPSRASLMTGLRPDHIKVYDLDRHFRDELPDVVTLPQAFRRAGYFTARVGKVYHYNVPAGIGTNGLDDRPSWHEVVNPQGRDVADEALIFNAEPHRPISAALSWLAAEGSDEEQTDGLIATQAIQLLETSRDQPFFLAVGFFRPHTPYVAPKSYFDLYPLDQQRLPYAPEGDRDDIPVAAFAHNCPVPNYGLSEPLLLAATQAYYACVSFVDAQVGRLLDALDRLELADSTIVVLWSDHGYHLGEHQGIWQKAHAVRTGCPGTADDSCPPGSRQWADLPTGCRICRHLPHAGCTCRCRGPDRSRWTGPDASAQRSARAQWDGQAVTQVLRPADDRLAVPVMGCSIRTSRYRYTEWGDGTHGVELYDHQTDPGEFHNLAIDPDERARAVIERLRPLLRARASGKTPQSPVNPAKL